MGAIRTQVFGHTLSNVSFYANSKCAEKYQPWRWNPTTSGPICCVLKWRSYSVIGFVFDKNVDKKSFVFGNSDISNVTTSAPSRQIPTFDPPLDSQGSVLSSTLRISAVRHTRERITPYFWKQSKNIEQNVTTKSQKVAWVRIVSEVSKEKHWSWVCWKWSGPVVGKVGSVVGNIKSFVTSSDTNWDSKKVSEWKRMVKSFETLFQTVKVANESGGDSTVLALFSTIFSVWASLNTKPKKIIIWANFVLLKKFIRCSSHLFRCMWFISAQTLFFEHL